MEKETINEILNELYILKESIKSFRPFKDDHRYFRTSFPQGYEISGSQLTKYQVYANEDCLKATLSLLSYIRNFSCSFVQRWHLKRAALIQINNMIKFVRMDLN